jgi:glycosyltransferase involved in cell wall biosynthesis
MNLAKRILFISPQPFFQWRGSPIRVRFVLESLSQSGHRVDLLTLPIGEDAAIANVRIIRVSNPFRAKQMPIGPSLLKLGFDVLIFFKALALIRRNRYEVIHGIEEAGILGLVLARIFGLKAVFEKHSDPFSYRRGVLRNILLSLYAAVESQVIKRADLIICTGPGLARGVKNMGTDRPVHTIFDMPSSMVEAQVQPTRTIAQELRQQPDEILAMYVGSFAVYQGVDLLFASLPLVHAEAPFIRYVIIGGNSEELAQRQLQVHEQGLADRITFVGKVAPDILPDYLAAADILLLPRQSGLNTPLKALDYFKAGRAVLATDIPANQLILDETTAVFSAPEAGSFAQQLCRLARDPELRKQLGANGRRLYEQKYSFSAFQRRLERAYAELDRQEGAGRTLAKRLRGRG